MNKIKLTVMQAEYLFHSVEDKGTQELQNIFGKSNIFERKTPLKLTVSNESLKWILSEVKSQINYFNNFITEYQDEELNEYWAEELKSYRFTLISLKNLLKKVTP